MTLTCTCGRPCPDAYLCGDCLDQLHADLATAPTWAHQLGIEVAKLSRKGSGPGGHTRRTEQPLPFAPHAANALHTLRNELVTACRVVALDQPDRLPGDTIAAMSAWLDRNLAALALRPEAPDIAAGITRALMRAQTICDSPVERVYLGPCPTEFGGCGADLYAPRDATVATCDQRRGGCGMTWDATILTDQRNDAARDHLLSISDIARVLGVKRGTVAKWATRRRLLPVTIDPRNGDQLYRYGDALALHEPG